MGKLWFLTTGLLGASQAVGVSNSPSGETYALHATTTTNDATASSTSSTVSTLPTHQCVSYETHAGQKNVPVSPGKAQLAYQRPDMECRKVTIPEVEDVIVQMKDEIHDPDLYRLFENTFPNTLDTAIAWRGLSGEPGAAEGEELTMITTGDINAMWLRDSANQLRSYKGLLAASDSPDSLASLFRGAINLQARFIRLAPHCNAFQAPPESELPTQVNGWADGDIVKPAYSRFQVFECKYELDSLAAFLQLSYDYHHMTQDTDFFGKHRWVHAIKVIMDVAKALTVGTYSEKGAVLESPYTFQRYTSTSSETLYNSGSGSPVKGGTGMIRSAFRPSDDSCNLQLFVPGNMMFSEYLGRCSEIMKAHNETLAGEMASFAASIKRGIEIHGKIAHPSYGEIYAYEVDGFGGHIAMDDANIPSLLSAPILGYLDMYDPTYLNTRKFVLSADNPYYMRGSVINAVGGPHVGPGMAWPMALVVQILTTDDDEEIVEGLRQLLFSTNGLGLIHETVNSGDASIWTRPWFSWANGLFGQMILDLKQRKPHILQKSFQ